MINYSIYIACKKPGTKKADYNTVGTMAYGSAQMNEKLSFDQFCKHIAAHNSPFSKGTVKGILTDAVACLREQLLAGNKVSLGEAAVAVAPFDTVQRLQQEGYKVEMAFPKDGVPWYIAPVAVFKGGQNPEGARALVDWVLSEKGQAALAEYNTQAPIRPGVKLAPAVQAMRDSNLMKMDVVKAGQDREGILKVWQEKFGDK